MSLSGDGNTVAVGAPSHWTMNGRPGYVKVYRKTAHWEQLGQAIKGDAIGNQFGVSVSLSSEGETLAVGANINDNENGETAGHVRVFGLNDTVSASIWQQLGQDINGEATSDNSGISVSLSANGKIVAIGAFLNDGNGEDSGHVRVYQMDEASSVWTQLGQNIDGEAAGDMFGISVSLSSDGKTLATGAYWNNNENGYRQDM